MTLADFQFTKLQVISCIHEDDRRNVAAAEWTCIFTECSFSRGQGGVRWSAWCMVGNQSNCLESCTLTPLQCSSSACLWWWQWLCAAHTSCVRDEGHFYWQGWRPLKGLLWWNGARCEKFDTTDRSGMFRTSESHQSLTHRELRSSSIRPFVFEGHRSFRFRLWSQEPSQHKGDEVAASWILPQNRWVKSDLKKISPFGSWKGGSKIKYPYCRIKCP